MKRNGDAGGFCGVAVDGCKGDGGDGGGGDGDVGGDGGKASLKTRGVVLQSPKRVFGIWMTMKAFPFWPSNLLSPEDRSISL